MNKPIGTAEWADPEQFAEKNRFGPGKFWLGRSPVNGEPIGYADDRHVCLVSGSRAGKGTTTIINNLCLWPGSLVVIDPKGENATVTAARRGGGDEHCEGMGQDVHVLDPFGAAQVEHSLRSRFNPLAELDPEAPATIDEAGRLADSIVVANPQSNDPFWDQSARTMVKGLILHVLTAPQFEGRRNLITIRSLIARGDHEGLKALREMGEEELPSAQAWLWEGVARNDAFNGVVAGIGESMVGLVVNSTKQFESVLQVANRHTEFLDSPGMQECLATSDFKLAELKTNPKGMSIYLSLPQRYMGEHFRWLRMVTTLLLTEMEAVKAQPATGHRVLVCLDEFAGLKRMEVVENAVAQIAGFGVKLFFVLQSFEQLKAVYKDTWETFIGNCGIKLFFGIDDNFSRKYISERIGDTEVIRTARSHSDGESTSSSTSSSTNEGTNWSEGENAGVSSGESRSSNSKAMPLFLRDTAAFFRALSGSRETGTSANRGTSSGTSSSHGGSSGESAGTSESRTSSKSRGTSESVHKRPLITPDEIGLLFSRIDDEASPIYPGLGLVLLTGRPPGVVRRTNYYEEPLLEGCFQPHPDFPHIALEERQRSRQKRIAEITLFETPFGTYDIHGNGTFTDRASGLMWMQAAVGMVWDGEEFTGEAQKFTWLEASKLFGKGVTLPESRRTDDRCVDDPRELHEPDILLSDPLNGYVRGSANHQFMGFSDWRLPTVHECWTMAFMDEKGSHEYSEHFKQLFPGMGDIDRDWGGYSWTATMSSMLPKAISKVLKFIGSDASSVGAWAMGLKNGFRFNSDGDFPRPVVLVRNKMLAASTLTSDDYDRAREAFEQGRLFIKVRTEKHDRWVWVDKVIVPRDSSKREFINQAVVNRDNWMLAWETELVDFFVLG